MPSPTTDPDFASEFSGLSLEEDEPRQQPSHLRSSFSYSSSQIGESNIPHADALDQQQRQQRQELSSASANFSVSLESTSASSGDLGLPYEATGGAAAASSSLNEAHVRVHRRCNSMATPSQANHQAASLAPSAPTSEQGDGEATARSNEHAGRTPRSAASFCGLSMAFREFGVFLRTASSSLIETWRSTGDNGGSQN